MFRTGNGKRTPEYMYQSSDTRRLGFELQCGPAMKLIFRVLLVIGAVVSVSSAQSLGDIARQTRAHAKPDTKVITNDDLPHALEPSAPPATTNKPDEKSSNDAEAGPDATQAAKDREKDLRDRFAKGKADFDLLTRELTVLQREYRIQTTEYYADAGTRLRDPKAFTEKSKKFEDDIATKQKDLDNAKRQIEALKEEARRAGLSSRLFDEQ
jgi:hypothetical protein